MDRQVQIREWQGRLENAFRGTSGVVGERLLAVIAAEHTHEAEIPRACAGFLTLMDSFQDFLLLTYAEAAAHDGVKNINIWAIVAATFHQLRCALIGFLHGYPYPAAGNIRAVFENTFYLGAVLHGVIQYDDLFSFASVIDHDADSTAKVFRTQRDHMRKIEEAVTQFIRGERSNLSPEDQKEIAHVLRLLHSHVHRAESSIVMASLNMVKERRLPSLSPAFHDKATGHFATYAVLAAWLFHRVVPFLSSPTKFHDVWIMKQKLLDDSFRFYVEKTDAYGASAFCRLLDTRFSFDVDAATERVRVEAMNGKAHAHD